MVRIVGTVFMLFLAPLSASFYVAYTISGVSDVLDGTVARATGKTTQLGARLDSIADLLFYTVMILRVFPVLWERLPQWVWLCVAFVLLLRLLAYITAYVKYHRFASMHTYLNKLTGFCLFFVPYLLPLSWFSGYCVVVCAVGGIGSGEELILHLYSSRYDERRKSIFLHPDQEDAA